MTRKDIPGAQHAQRKRPLDRALWSGFVGLVFGLFTFMVVVLVFRNFTLDDMVGLRMLRFTVTFAGFFTGSLLWWLLVSRAKTITLKRGFWAGALIGLVSLLTASFFRLLYVSFSVSQSVPGGQMLTFRQIVLDGLFRGFINAIILGWATIPFGGLIGGILSFWQAKMWGMNRGVMPLKKSSLKLLKIFGVVVTSIYIVSGVITWRSHIISKEPFHGWIYYWNGPYRGKVVELDTGKPIEGAVVAGSWGLEVMVGWPQFCDAVETTTDRNGEFVLPRAWCISFWPIARLSSGSQVVFKPGYLGYPPLGNNEEEIAAHMPNFTGDEFEDASQYYIIELGRPKTREERELTNDHADRPLDFDQTYNKLPILLKLINEDRKALGFKGDIGQP